MRDKPIHNTAVVCIEGVLPFSTNALSTAGKCLNVDHIIYVRLLKIVLVYLLVYTYTTHSP